MTSTDTLPTPATPAAAGQRPPSRSRRRAVRFNSAYLFIAPSMILIGVFIAEPIVQSGWMSLHDWTIGEATHKFVGLANYTQLYHDSRFWNALRVTLVYTVFVSVGQVVLGLAIASRLRGPPGTRRCCGPRTSSRSSPRWWSSASSGSSCSTRRSAWSTRGCSTSACPRRNWLESTSLALPTVIAVGIWKNVGFTMIVLLAGMQQVPADLYEAATLDGAGPGSGSAYVTLPALRPRCCSPR